MERKKLHYALGGAYIGVAPILETIQYAWLLTTIRNNDFHPLQILITVPLSKMTIEQVKHVVNCYVLC